MNTGTSSSHSTTGSRPKRHSGKSEEILSTTCIIALETHLLSGGTVDNHNIKL